MATEKVRFRVRRGMQAEWDSVNPILADGEIGFAKDTGELRIGDGVTRWADRPRYAYADQVDAALAAALEAKEAAELAATSAQSVVTQDLSAISASLTQGGESVKSACWFGSSMDYDPSWPQRVQHSLGWYNEPLNTELRGAQREYPALGIAMLVNFPGGWEVRLFTMDNGTPEMWMIVPINKSDGYISLFFQNSVGPESKITLAEGWLIVGAKANYGVKAMDFTTNRMLSSRGCPRKGIEARGEVFTPEQYDESSKWAAEVGAASVRCAKVAVLPDAPINRETGLAAPTVFLGDYNYVRAYREDGFYAQYSPFPNNSDIWSVQLRKSDGALVAVSFPNGRGVRVFVYHAPFVNGEARLPDERYSYATDNSINPMMSYGSEAPEFLRALEDGESFAMTGEIVKIKANPSDPARGMIARIGDDYNTGWMVGDCKGAFLASTDATALVGEELVTNGDFATGDLTGWTGTNATYDAGALRCSDGSFSQAVFSGAKKVLVSWTQTVNAGSRSRLRLRNAADSADVGPFNYFTGSGDYSIVVDTAAGLYLRFYVESGHDVSFDNISVSPVDADRSAYANGLIVNGTLTREPVADGAQLVAYSGFSADNYLSQPYNADLDFGTGDFCVMGWINTYDGGAAPIASFGDPLGSGNQWQFIKASNPDAFGVHVSTDDGSMSYTATSAVNDREWHFGAIVREGRSLRIYSDGVLEYENQLDAVMDFSNANGRIVVGASASLANFFDVGSLALLRISATAPTAEQIKFAFEQERRLFREGAQCAISDGVVYDINGEEAASVDPVTGLLHVGSTTGMATFRDLVRVETNDTPASGFVEAYNGAVVAGY